MAKKFEFSMVTETDYKVEPIKKSVPDWYKVADKFSGGKLKLVPVATHTYKVCMPFQDSLISGYSMPLIHDILVEQTPTGPLVTWRPGLFEVLSTRTGEETVGLPVPVGFSPIRFIWHMPCAYRVPKGYSLLITHPFNRHDLPFQTLTGIVDADFAVHPGSLPVFFNTTFEGIIPAGTPIAQMLPIKRDSWVLEDSTSLGQDHKKTLTSVGSKIIGWYRETRWVKKSYS